MLKNDRILTLYTYLCSLRKRNYGKSKKTFILKISKQDGSIVMIPFSNKTDASRQEKKELKNKDNRMLY